MEQGLAQRPVIRRGRVHHGHTRREYSSVPVGPIFQPGKFGRMFPELRPLDGDAIALQRLAAKMKDENDAASHDNRDIPAGFTYLGQFIDHDMSLDTTTMPEVMIDPQAVFNFRTPKLELDSLYGIGPDVTPYFYQLDDPDKFTLGATVVGRGDPGIPEGLPNDLPRFNTIALIGDPRNDENLAVAQTHVAFLKFHNRIVDTLRADGMPDAKVFAEARRLTTWHYQKLVLCDFVERLCDPAVFKHVNEQGRAFFQFEHEPFIPVEFSVAAYRLGHSMVRNTYDFNRVFRSTSEDGRPAATLDLLFTFSRVSGPGPTVPIPSDWCIDWRRFYDFGISGIEVNASRGIDPFLAESLHKLPNQVPGMESLPERNLLRGLRMGLPSGQDVARRMGYKPLTPKEVASGPDGQEAFGAKLHEETPLWYYILKEALIQQKGKRLGEVGSRIVAEVFLGLLEGDPNSFLAQNKHWEPELPHAEKGKFTMVDMLTFVGDLNPVGD